MATATIVEPLTGADPNLARRVLHYGWVTILRGAVAMAATYPGRTRGLGMVTEPLLKDLGLADPDGRVFYASLNLWGTLLGALSALRWGGCSTASIAGSSSQRI
jgi:hypothetical protein